MPGASVRRRSQIDPPAALLLRNGVDILVAQEFLGHTSVATTERYTHVTKEHLVGVLRGRHPALWMYPKT